MVGGAYRDLVSLGWYPIAVLVLLLAAYLLNQLDRYMVSILSTELKKVLDFNDLEYQIIAGPAFTLVYTFAGIPLGLAADRLNRTRMLAGCLFLWSVATALSGLSTNYWELLVARAFLGLGEAGCTPMAASIIGDLFPPAMKATAMGVYNWGIYTGYSLSYTLGNFVKDWRWAFIVSGLPGVALAPIIYFLIKEPERGRYAPAAQQVAQQRQAGRPSLLNTGKYLLTHKCLVLLCLAGAVRNAGGYVWALNTQPFFEQYRGLTKDQIGQWMSWIPLVGGSLGAVWGGFISDRVVKGRSRSARIAVLVVSQVVAAPFAAGALWLPTSHDHPSPWPFLCLIPSNIIGEMWVGVTLTTVLELVPSNMSVTAVATYLFIISNIGGNMNVLVSPLRKYLNYESALLILFPGLYLLSALLFALTGWLLIHEEGKRQHEALEKSRGGMSLPGDDVMDPERQALLDDDQQAE